MSRKSNERSTSSTATGSSAAGGAQVDEDATGVTLDVLVQPRASRAKIGPVHDGRVKVSVTAPPVDGEANAAVIELFAKQLGVPKSAVEVIAGASSRRKRLRITGATKAAIEALIA